MKVMIIAHPDDLFLGWKELQDGGWTVICMTNGDKVKYACAFSKVIEKYNCQGYMFNYPDAFNLKWTLNVQQSISADLRPFLTGHIDQIVTHGQSDSDHHRVINKIVTDIVTSKGKQST